MIRVKGYARRQATRQDHWWDLAGERALDVAGESYRAAKEAARLATAMAQHAVTVCVEDEPLDSEPSPMDDDDSDDNSITLDQMREKARPWRGGSWRVVACLLYTSPSPRDRG